MSESDEYRSAYREFYPGVLRYNKKDWERRIKQSSDPKEKEYLRALAEDCLRIQDGVSLIPWPNKDILAMVKLYAEPVCKQRIAFRKKISRKEVEALRRIGQDPDRILVTNSQKRLEAAKVWQHPFDAIDLSLDEPEFSVFDDVLGVTQDYIFSGHGWFGVGEWNIANRNYLNALTWSLASNNMPAIEMIVRFLADTYTAANDYQSASNLADEFSRSSYTEMARVTFFQTRNDTYESVILGFARSDLWQEVDSWLRRIRSECEREANLNIHEWNIIKRLWEVHAYLDDFDTLRHLEKAVEKLRIWMNSLYALPDQADHR